MLETVKKAEAGGPDRRTRHGRTRPNARNEVSYLLQSSFVASILVLRLPSLFQTFSDLQFGRAAKVESPHLHIQGKIWTRKVKINPRPWLSGPARPEKQRNKTIQGFPFPLVQCAVLRREMRKWGLWRTASQTSPKKPQANCSRERIRYKETMKVLCLKTFPTLVSKKLAP